MTISRSEQIDLDSTSYYHCMTRCVRRTYLCGTDKVTGKDYSHRKGWIVARIKKLAALFAIKICAYAVMDNHYHIVCFVDVDEANNWSDKEVQFRWSKLFWRDAKNIDELTTPMLQREKKLAIWRARLMDISWFMRCLNEFIARQSNKEDGCKGRFWESRFKCQALLDEGAILSAMAYVDLNPIRAKMASTPEDSAFTSIHERIKWVKKHLNKKKAHIKRISQSLSMISTNHFSQNL